MDEEDVRNAERKTDAAHDRARRAALSAADSLEKSAELHDKVAVVQQRANRHTSHHVHDDHQSAVRHHQEAELDRQAAARKRQEASSD